MANDVASCPGCGKRLSDKVIMMPSEMIEIIKLYNPQPSYSICTRCGRDILNSAAAKIDVASSAKQVEALRKSVPIVSIQSPLNWEYDVVGIVTAQSVVGTGAIAEFTASIADFFGKNSPAFVHKIVQGEDSGFSQLVNKTIEMGGNAIVAVDIDYAELGSLKGMIMVCMTGTAVTVKNTDVFGPERKLAIESLQKAMTEHQTNSRMIDAYWKHNASFPT
jgi:uncharacterized protein YbjQ (UPF0145 family)